MNFTVLEMDAKRFTAYMRKSVKNIVTREDHEAFCWVIDIAKERGIIGFEVWRNLNTLALESRQVAS